MLHGPHAAAGGHVHRHVLSVMSPAEPEPNRPLRASSPGPLKTKSQPSSPSPIKSSGASRISTAQHARACRFLARFMDSILIRPLPVTFSSEPSIPSILDDICHKSTICSPNPSVSEVVSGFQELLGEEKRLRGEEREKNESGSGGAQSCSHKQPSSSKRGSENLKCIKKPQRHCLGVSKSHVGAHEGLESSGSSPTLLELPLEIVISIFGFVEEKNHLLSLAGVNKDVRRLVLSETRWKKDLDFLASECRISKELIRRSDDIPSYLRWNAINRWSSTYRSAKSLLEKLELDGRGSGCEKEMLESIFSQMMPGVSPWSPPQYHLEEIELTLPTTIVVFPLEAINALRIYVQLTHGVYRYELMRKGLSPEIEFVIHNPTGRRPTIKCETLDLYHPCLSSTTNHLDLPEDEFYDKENTVNGSANPKRTAKSIERLILRIRDAFSDLGTMVSDFTL